MRTDRKRLIDHALALSLVAATVAVRGALSATDMSAAFLLSSGAIAAAAWIGGVSTGVTATLAGLLAARILARVDLTTSMLSLSEGLLITWLASKASRAVGESVEALASADARIRELLAVQRRLRRLGAVSSRLEQAAVECAAFLVDDGGRVVEWRDGAARLFGWTADAVQGRPMEMLLAGRGGQSFDDLVAATSNDGAPRVGRECRRADGSTFDADVEVHAVADQEPHAHIVVVRDRTREHEWRTFADASADLQATLREEADMAQRQLATLQHVTDPSLNLLPNSQAITALLDRLQAAIQADGVAVVCGVGRQHRRILPASEGLEVDAGGERRRGEGWTPQAGRILVVHNDPARASSASVAGWRGDPSSLIAVPVVSGSHVEGTIEAVRIKTRRSTEWEIALVQVVAAQIAGRLQSDSMFGADAVA